MSRMENYKEWQRIFGEVMIGKTDVQKKQKIETNRRRNDSYIQKEDVYKLAWAMTYLCSELQKDGYKENMIPESE